MTLSSRCQSNSELFIILSSYIQISIILEYPFCSEKQVLCAGQAVNLALDSSHQVYPKTNFFLGCDNYYKLKKGSELYPTSFYLKE